MTEHERLTAIWELLVEMKGTLGEMSEQHKTNIEAHKSFNDRLSSLEEGQKPLTWLGQTKTLLLWGAALVGAVAGCSRIIEKLL